MGKPLDSFKTLHEKRLYRKLMQILNDPTDPMRHYFDSRRSNRSGRFLLPGTNCYKASSFLVLLTSLNCCMSTPRLVHYALFLTPACWKSNNTNARLMASALSLALDPTFGIHSHKIWDTAQTCHLLKPNWKPFSSSEFKICVRVEVVVLGVLS